MTADEFDATALAARLRTARADRTAIAPPSDGTALDLDEAYAVQRVLRDGAGPLAGWKLALTSGAEQARAGVPEPVHGFLAGSGALDLGEALPCGELIAPRAEPEIAFLLGRDLAGPHVTASDVLSATAGVAPAVEVLDSRYVAGGSPDARATAATTAADAVADNTSAARFVVGAPVGPSGVDLRLVGVLLEHDGTLVATASGAAALGHPAAAVAWLVRRLAATGEGLAAGQVVLSGGLTEPVAVAPGEVVTVTIDRLGTVELPCA